MKRLIVFFLMLITILSSAADAKENKKTLVLPPFSITILTQELGVEASSIVPADLVTFWNIIEVEGESLIPTVTCKRIDKTPDLEFIINRPEDNLFNKMRGGFSWTAKNERIHLLSKVDQQQIGENFSAKAKDVIGTNELEPKVLESAKNFRQESLFVYMKDFKKTDKVPSEVEIAPSIKGRFFINSGELMEKFKKQVLDDLKANQKDLRYLVLYNVRLPQWTTPPPPPTTPVPITIVGSKKEPKPKIGSSPVNVDPPLEAKGHLQQGMIYAKLKDYDNAIKEFTLAIGKHPEYAAAYSNRASAYIQKKRYDKAFEDLTKAGQIKLNDPVIFYNLTALFSVQIKIGFALDSLDKCLEYGFNDYDALQKDPDLANLRKDPEFRKILQKHKIFLK